MLHYVHSSLIDNSQKLERTQMLLNRGMDTENVLHLLSAIKNNKFMKFIGKWMDLEYIILSEGSSLLSLYLVWWEVKHQSGS